MNEKRKFFHRKLRDEGCKRWTIPMDKLEHLDDAIDVMANLLEELQKVRKQRIPSYLRLLHARSAIEDANYSTKLLANKGNDTVHKSYKGAV
tara:strand:- start:689 stop:964 length:276 start_codon:yes stop_codon:yes gene_type:complete